jgi:DNA mismatch endonuclease (patch repair protein)
MGYRYVLHRKGMPGTPDLVFPGRKKIIFVNGCFWHGHFCKFGEGAKSKSNVEFWEKKISGNVKRDARNVRSLRKQGWKVAVVWECSVKRDDWQGRICRFLES